MVKLQLFEGDSIDAAINGTSAIDGARIALQHRLYVPTWQLQSDLGQVKFRAHDKKIAIVFKHNTPIAVAFLDGQTRLIQVFCKPEERRKGYATMAVQAIKPEKRIHAHQGISGTWMFWEKQGISTKW
jgi:hypothetical protein